MSCGYTGERAPPPTTYTLTVVGRDSRITQHVERVEQPAHHTFVRGAASCAGSVSERSPCSVPVASGRFGVRSPSKYGQQHDAAGAGRGTRAPAARARRASRPSRRAIVSVTLVAFSVHTRGRNRPVASANPATAPDGVARRRAGDREDRARRAERDRDVAFAAARARARRPCCRRSRRRRSPVADVPATPPGAARSARPRDRASSEREHVADVAPGRRRPVARARRVAAVGDQLAGELQRQPVVGEQHVRDAGRTSSGSCSRSHASLVIVNDATGTDADRIGPAPAAPQASTSASACGADSVSFQSLAGRSTCRSSSSTTMPCCWPATEMAATS